jgi:hypothetical protein
LLQPPPDAASKEAAGLIAAGPPSAAKMAVADAIGGPMGLVMAAGIAAKESGEAPSKAAEEKTEEAEKAVDVS